MTESKLYQKSLDLVASFLNENSTAEDIINAWPHFSAKKFKELCRLYEAIDHYHVDADIRAGNPEYEAEQLEVIKALYQSLKANTLN